MWRTQVMALVATGLVAASFSSVSTATPNTSWGPVQTVARQSFDELSTATDDHGTVVAAWVGRPPNRHVFISVHKVGKRWSKPVRFHTDSPAAKVATGGEGGWVMWSDQLEIFVSHVSANGAIGAPEPLGDTTVPLQQDASIAVGANDAVAAAWHRYNSGSAGEFAYHPAGAAWLGPEPLPEGGTIVGLSIKEPDFVDLVLAKDNPDLWHQKLSYSRFRFFEDWQVPVVIATSAYLSTAAGRSGALVVGWQQDNGDGTFSAVARYKPDGERAVFGSARQLFNNVPFGSHVAVAMSNSGYAVAVSHTSATGSQQFRFSPVTSSGQWLSSTYLSMTGFSYTVSISPDGDALVTSRLSAGVQLARCPEQEGCDPVETNAAPDRFPSASIGDDGVINLLWGHGCFGRACYPTSLLAQRGA